MIKKKPKKVIKKPKKKSRSRLVKDLDSLFSIYIRLRDSDKDGMVTCPLCKNKIHWKEAQNMHFITRGCYALRRDANNCHA